MSNINRVKVSGIGALIGLIFVALVFFAIGRLTSQPAAKVALPTPTATRVVPTPTPDLALRAPRVIAAWMSSGEFAGCDSCNSITFQTKGAFYMVASCNPFQVFAGSNPSFQLQLFNASGHLIDTVQHTCGDPNNDTVMTDVITEQDPAGQYQLQVNPSGFVLPVSVLIVDASSS